MSSGYRDLHGDAYREWKQHQSTEYAEAQRQAFLDGFETAANESENFRLLRQWLEEQRDQAIEQWEEHDDEHQNIRRMAFSEVLVKLHEMGCEPQEADDAN